MTEKEFEELTRPDALKFLSQHICDDPEELAFKFQGNKDIPIRAVCEQIKCYNKSKKKLPVLSKRGMLYEKTAFEQSSGEKAAYFKASMLNGNRIIDLTGGLGIDDYFIAENFQELIYCELDPLRIKLFEYNLNILGRQNIKIMPGDSIDILKSFPDNYFDWIYADPSRRNESRRFVGLQNCSPDIIEHESLLLSKAGKVLIKASPALELEEVRKQIPSLKEFIVLSIDNECKEVLLLLNNDTENKDLLIRSVSFNTLNNSIKTITSSYRETHSDKACSEIKKYFYEPDAAIIKARLASRLTEDNHVSFINRSVDYLTSDILLDEFPGRIFIVNDILPYKKQTVKEYLKTKGINKANIARRDFPDAPEIIRKNLKLKDGGDNYLFFTRNNKNNLIVVFCQKADKGEIQ